MAQVNLAYIAAAANRANVSSSRPSTDNLIAFGTGRAIALWHSTQQPPVGIHRTLQGHTGDVTALKFLNPTDQAQPSNVFVSGDNVGVVRVWKEDEPGALHSSWSTIAVLTGHTQSISSVAVHELAEGQGRQTHLLVITGGSEGVVQSWKVTPDGAKLLQKINLKGKIPLELELGLLPASSSFVLAIGATETKIQIFSSPSTSQINFTKSLSLEGHTDWVRALSFITPLPIESPSTSSVGYDISPGEVLLASGSQDNYIRLWRFSRISSNATTSTTEEDPLAALDAELRVKAYDFTVGEDTEATFSVSAESVLLGHDAWVTGLHWAPLTPSFPTLQLLSSSADRSMIFWTPSASTTSSIWTSTMRFGEFSSETNLGFFGALWGKGGESVAASGWGGSWHVWKRGNGLGEWEAVVGVSGHFGMVKSVKWEPEGKWLLSAGADMSTRLHALWKRDDGTGFGKEVATWHELGRPQIHGYPIASLSFIDRLQFVSGADEKIVRVFDAPTIAVRSLKSLAGVEGLGDEEDRPMAANVPPLGLSNRAIANSAEAENIVPDSADPYNAPHVLDLTVVPHPPFEEQLLGSTLWPETEKLYGHGFELVALTSTHLPSSRLLATACKATLPEHAVIRLYDSTTWKPWPSAKEVLAGHSLTITKLEFSHGDKWLLSVSRDRSWRVFERNGDSFVNVASGPKAHARIIWDGCWSVDDSFFATASRDKTVKVWTPPESSTASEGAPTSGAWPCVATLKFDEAATAVASTLSPDRSAHLLAVGLETGQIHLFSSALATPSEWIPLTVLQADIAHVLTVTSLSFCPDVKDVARGVIKLASGSEDRSVRVFEIVL